MQDHYHKTTTKELYKTITKEPYKAGLAMEPMELNSCVNGAQKTSIHWLHSELHWLHSQLHWAPLSSIANPDTRLLLKNYAKLLPKKHTRLLLKKCTRPLRRVTKIR
ncbi:hypothetical protein F8M41_005017 [Gigaspora margarita]|uniref:Uncharacterized protein n=1 Tax=Gigaspora margarita TaxID=4874 RepID=A0A8H4A765_GIGMA|nr:hypothetical protein F8M41_005017 [Gigaspora margarita]